MSHRTEAEQAIEHPLLWSPDADIVKNSQMHRFQRWLSERGIRTNGYRELQAWSVEDLSGFWSAVWDYFEVEADAQPTAILESTDMPGAAWFPGARLNYAQNLLRSARERPDDIAVIGTHESSPDTSWTWGQLAARTAALAAHLRELGVGPGDRVAAVLPHIPETVAALLATASVGAIWSVVNTDFGVPGVADRFAQIEPKVLFTVDGYEFNGKVHERVSAIPALRDALPTVNHVILVDQLPADTRREHDIELPQTVSLFSRITATESEPRYEQVDFDHPLWILYSSGTTGKPKGIVHGHGGITLEALKANHLHYDLDSSSRAYFAVSTTWVVWNLVVNTMMAGSSMVTYDGAPTFATKDRHLAIVAEQKATFFGTGAAVLTMIERAGVNPRTHLDLSRLRAVFVTGSPLPDTTWEWIYREISPEVRVGSDSGGTDVATAFIGSNPLQPVRRGLLMGSYLGVASESWDEDGTRVFDEVGEFVVTKPMPSMPLFFWGDSEGTKYHEAYFDHFPGVWRHGDWVTEHEDGSLVIHGRSDSTINRGGIRMGSADITRVVDHVDGVESSMVIGAELDDGDYYMPLFIVPSQGRSVDEVLRESVTEAIRTEVSPRYLPDEIIEVAALPRTRTGKLMEVPIKSLLQGGDPAKVNRTSADNECTIDWFVEFAERFRKQRT